MKKEIYIIRHGETMWNVLKKIQGQEADIELNENGKNQAKLTGKYLKKYRYSKNGFDCILVSPLIRAKQTAEIISEKIKFDKSKIIYMNELKEIKKGKISGLLSNNKYMIKLNNFKEQYLSKFKDPIELTEKAEYRNIIDKILLKKFDNKLGMEKSNIIEKKINKVIDFIKKCKCKKIIIVTHFDTIEFLLKNMFNLSFFPEGDLIHGANCMISYIKYDGNNFNLVTEPNTLHLGIKDL
jgi:broad specificity phosphatase PhoE